jgi:hypothetical protein
MCRRGVDHEVSGVEAREQAVFALYRRFDLGGSGQRQDDDVRGCPHFGGVAGRSPAAFDGVSHLVVVDIVDCG